MDREIRALCRSRCITVKYFCRASYFPLSRISHVEIPSVRSYALRAKSMLSPNQITEYLLKQRLALTAYVYTITRNYHLAEDVFQEICVKAVSMNNHFSSSEHLTLWFRTSSRHRAIDIIRTHEGHYVGLSDEFLAVLESQWGQPTDTQRDALLKALRNCLKALTPRSQQIIQMRYFENRSGAEIAQYMGSKIESAYQTISRIHKSLNDCITQKMKWENS